MAKKKKNKKNFTEEDIDLFCEAHNMKYHFSVCMLFIMTPFGTWYVSLDKDTYKLYHKNSYYFLNINQKGFANYHSQKKEFYDILDALKYIHIHDVNKIKREIKREKDNDIFRKKSKR